MLSFGNKEFRNLQEQVLKNAQDIQKFNYGGAVLSEFGIKVVGHLESANDLPDPTLYTEDDVGDAFAIGTETPYSLYILTRPFVEGDPLQWFDIGQFPVPGPQGETGSTGATGAQGERGNSVFTGVGVPAVSSSYIAGDKYIDTTTGYLYSYAGTIWTFVGSLKGPQGPQGLQGEQGIRGPQGEQGIQGPQGNPGQSFHIIGQVNYTSQLPSAAGATAGSAYLVGIGIPYHLYVLVESPTKAWMDTGTFNSTEIVTLPELASTSGTLNSTDYAKIQSSPDVIIIHNHKIYHCSNYDTTNNRYDYSSIYSSHLSDSALTANDTIDAEIIRIGFTDAPQTWVKSDPHTIYNPNNNYVTSTQLTTALADKQDVLVGSGSGQNIKTINNQSIVGSGNIEVVTDLSGYATTEQVNEGLLGKQNTLVSGTNIKTINNTSLLGEGNISINSAEWGNISGTLSNQTDLQAALNGKQAVIDSSNKLAASNVSGLATVATSGSYDDLLDKPTIPTVSYPVTDVKVDNVSVMDGTVAKITMPTISYPVTDVKVNNVSVIDGSVAKVVIPVTDVTVGGTSVVSSGTAVIPALFSGSYNDLTNKPDLSVYAESSDLATVATSGDYDDLLDKPDLSVYAESSDLATVATSGSYTDLSNKPTIPTDTSDLTNNAGFITSSALSGYATESYVNSAIQGLGTVFNIKGSVATVSALPASGNSIGDVYYVEATQSGYIWIEIDNTEQWEELGAPIDLSGYVETTDLASVAFSGDYDDLLDKPDLSNMAELNKSQTFTASQLFDLATNQRTVSYRIGTSDNHGTLEISSPLTVSAVAVRMLNSLGNIRSQLIFYRDRSGIKVDSTLNPNSSGYGINLPITDAYTASKIIATTDQIPSSSDILSTVSGDGYTKNAGTVTSVSAGTGLSVSGTSSVNPTVNVASGYKLPTTSEFNAKQDVATAYNTSNIVYSSYEPAYPVAGMIWLLPVGTANTGSGSQSGGSQSSGSGNSTSTIILVDRGGTEITLAVNEPASYPTTWTDWLGSQTPFTVGSGKLKISPDITDANGVDYYLSQNALGGSKASVSTAYFDSSRQENSDNTSITPDQPDTYYIYNNNYLILDE